MLQFWESLSYLFLSDLQPHVIWCLSLLFKVLWSVSQSQGNRWLCYFGVTDAVSIMQLPVKVQILAGVIPARLLTCLMLDAKNMRHLKSLRAFEKLLTLYIPFTYRNMLKISIMSLFSRPSEMGAKTDVLSLSLWCVVREKWCYGWSSSRHRSSATKRWIQKDEIPNKSPAEI